MRDLVAELGDEAVTAHEGLLGRVQGWKERAEHVARGKRATSTRTGPKTQRYALRRDERPPAQSATPWIKA